MYSRTAGVVSRDAQDRRWYQSLVGLWLARSKVRGGETVQEDRQAEETCVCPGVTEFAGKRVRAGNCGGVASGRGDLGSAGGELIHASLASRYIDQDESSVPLMGICSLTRQLTFDEQWASDMSTQLHQCAGHHDACAVSPVRSRVR